MSTGIKHALSTTIVLAVIFILAYFISLDSLLVNGIPLVYIFVITILSINSLFFIHSYLFKTDIFFDLIGSIVENNWNNKKELELRVIDIIQKT